MHFDIEGLGVPLNKEQKEMLDLSKISDDNCVTFPLFKEGTVANDYLEALFVSIFFPFAS